jgi:type I restriction enzyme S subunit
VSAVTQIKLGELMAKRTGSVDPSKYQDEVFDLYSIPAFDSGTPEVIAGSAIGSTKQVVEPNDVLLSKIVPHIRRTWVVGQDRGRRLIASGEWIVFRNARFDPGYLRHILRGDLFHAQFMKTVAGVGGSLLRARPAQVAHIAVPIPSLPEQRRMAAILDQADNLRTQHQRALAELDKLAQAVFVSMFGDMGNGEMRWPFKRFADGLATSFRNGVSPSSLGTVARKVLTLSAVTRQKFDGDAWKVGKFKAEATREEMVHDHDFLICRGNGNLGMVGRGQFPNSSLLDISFPDTIIAARIDQAAVTKAYLQTIWNSPFVRQQIEKIARTTNGTFKVNQSMLGEILLPCPPVTQQEEFSARIQVIEPLKSAHFAALAGSNALFASLQHRALTGAL